MPLIQDLWLRIKDQFHADDNRVGDHPKDLLKQASRSGYALSPEERQHKLQHIAAGIDTYYLGRHKMAQPPVEVMRSYQQLTERYQRLDRLHAAEQIIAKYGGPPTLKTIQDSVERSKQYYAQLVPSPKTQQRSAVEHYQSLESAQKTMGKTPLQNTHQATPPTASETAAGKPPKLRSKDHIHSAEV